VIGSVSICLFVFKCATVVGKNRVTGTFISFEGIDGSGKTTQLRSLANFLEQAGCDVLLTREPGGTPVGNRLRAALLDLHEVVDPLTELLVFAADRAQHVRRVLRPAIEAGRIVLSDRYADATTAYQGAGRGFSPQLIAEIIELATGGLKPDLTVLFDLSVEDSTARTQRRGSGTHRGDRLDAENDDFHRRVRNAYLQLAAEEPDRIKVINTNQPTELTQARLREIVVPFLKGRGHILKTEVAGSLS
jgi:dTMP kinase